MQQKFIEAEPGAASALTSAGSWSGVARSAGALVLVLALVAALAWLLKKTSGVRNATQGGARRGIEVLERTALDAGSQLVAVRFGAKVVLLAVSRGAGRAASQVRALHTIDDAAEANRFVDVVTGVAGDDGINKTRDMPTPIRHDRVGSRGQSTRADVSHRPIGESAGVA